MLSFVQQIRKWVRAGKEYDDESFEVIRDACVALFASGAATGAHKLVYEVFGDPSKIPMTLYKKDGFSKVNNVFTMNMMGLILSSS